MLNDKSSFIDMLFTINGKLLTVVGLEQTIYYKCHHNIYGSLNLNTTSFSTLLYGSLGLQKHRSDMHTTCNFISEFECSL